MRCLLDAIRRYLGGLSRRGVHVLFKGVDVSAHDESFRLSPRRRNLQLVGLAKKCEFLLDRGDLDGALTLANEIRVLAAAGSFRNGPLVGSLQRAARAYENAGDFSEAVVVRRWILGIEETASGESSSDSDYAREALVHALERSDDLAEASKLQSKVVDWRQDKLGPAHSRTIYAEIYLATIQIGMGETGRAKTLLETAIGNSEPAGAEAWQAKMWMGHLLHRQEDYARELPFREEALALSTAMWGPEDRRSLEDLEHLAMAFWELDEEDRARAMLRQALSVRERVFGEDDADTINTRDVLKHLDD